MISVIIPVYNVEDFLYTCLNSVLRQTYPDFEVICIDDASTDSSLDILEYFSKKDSRIKILKNESNKGPGYSRNRGLEIAKGEYISFLDGDDWFSPDAFEILVNKSENDNLDVLIFKNIVFYEEPHDFGMETYYDMEFMNKFENKIFNHFDLDKTKLFAMSNAPWNKFYLKSFLDDNNIRFPNENLIHEDNPFFYKVITSARRVSIIDVYLHNRRRRPNSITTLNNERLFDNIDISYLILDVFLENYQLYQYYKKEVLTYISNTLVVKYGQIENNFKEEFFKQVQSLYKRFIMDYGLYEDILNNVDKTVLEKFKFDEIAYETLSYVPKISVIIPVYNVEKYLKDCLDSVCNQTFKDIEIICINDGSTDNSFNILKQYEKRDFRIKIISQENKGISAARNTGLNYVNGEYIYFLDSDDYLQINALKKIYEVSKEKELDMVLFKLMVLDDSTKEKSISPYWEMELLKSIVGDKVFNYNDVYHHVSGLFACTMQSTFFKADLIGDLKFIDGVIWENDSFFLENLFRANRIYFYDEHLGVKREREKSISNSYFDKFSDCIRTLNEQFKIYEKYGHYDEEFRLKLYENKFYTIKLRFLQITEDYKQEFFDLFNKDCIEKKDEYENDISFNVLSDDFKKIFYAGLNSKDYEEFENNI